MTAARIGKIRLKSSGTEVRILNRQEREDGENYKGLIIQHARMIAETDEEMVGFVVIGLFADGSFNDSCRLDASGAVGRTMMPSYVAEIVRRSVITEPLCDGEI